MKRKLFIVLTIALSSCNSLPSEHDAKSAIKEKIMSESNNTIELLEFSKTDAVKKEFLGQSVYQMSYSGEIKFVEECWKAKDPKGRFFDDFYVTQEKPTGILFNPINPARRFPKGSTFEINGVVTFFNTENGWSPK